MDDKLNMKILKIKKTHNELKPVSNYPIFIFLTLFGFPLHKLKLDDHSYSGHLRTVLIVYRSIWAFMQLVVVVITFTFMLASWESNRYNTGHYIVMTANVIIAFMCYTFLCLHEKDIVVLLQHIEQHWEIFLTAEQQKENQRKIFWSSILLFVIYCTSILATFGIAYHINAMDLLTPKEEIVRKATNGSHPFTKITKVVFEELDIIQDLCGVTLHLIFCETFYLIWGILLIHISLAVNACFQVPEYGPELVTDKMTQAKSIMTFKVCHQKATELVEECDKLISGINLLWVSNTLSTCFAVYTLKYIHAVHHLLLGILIVEHLVSFFATFTASSLVNSQITDSTSNGIPGFEESISHLHFNDELATIMKMFVLYVGKMTIEVRGITIWGLFNVERGLMLTVSAAMLTYSVIVYDIGD